MIDLALVIQQHPACLESRVKLKSLLFDLYPNEKRLIYIILDAFECGIPQQIKRLNTIDPLRQKALVKQLVDEHGLQEQYAFLAINCWISAYGISCEKPDFTIGQQNHIIHDPNSYAPQTKVSGKLSDYEVSELCDGTIEILKFRGFEETHTIIPNEIDGKPVVGVGKFAYKACSLIETIVISPGIKYIKDGAFSGCTSMKAVQLPTSLEKLGSEDTSYYRDNGNLYSGCEGAFQGCIALTDVDIPNGIEYIPKGCFRSCTNLKSVIFPDKLAAIHDGAFQGCSSLLSISFPNSLVIIEDRAFSGCEKLTELSFNIGLKRIGDYAFKNCTLLEKVLCPTTIEFIGRSAFETGKYVQPTDRRRKPVYTRGKIAKLVFYCYAGSYSLEYARSTGYPIANAATK